VKGCDFKTALAELEVVAGITPVTGRQAKPRVVASYTYHDADGRPRYWKKRFEPGFNGRSKSFCFYHGASNGAEQSKGRGKGQMAIPYNLHLLAALPKGEPVFLLEGEGKADVLTGWGLCALSLDSGSKSTWKQEWTNYFAGRDIYILPDNDIPGEKYARNLAGHLAPVAASVKALRLPDLPPKGDIIDWLQRVEAAK